MSVRIRDPGFPFTHMIDGGIKPGKTMSFKGILSEGCERLSVNLFCGSDINCDEIALHFDCRFNYYNEKNQVVLNNRSKKGWDGKEERPKTFPFVPNGVFEILILVEPGEYKIYVNNHHVADFEHRYPLERVTHANVQAEHVTPKVKLTEVQL